MGSYIARKVLDETDRKLGSFISGKIAKLGIANLIGSIINEKICEKLPEMVYNEINKLEDQILSLRLSDICSKNEFYLEFIEKEVTDIYRKMLEKNLDEILIAINISELIVNKIRGFSARELEELVFGIMKRELRAIVYLGALLGFINVFIA